MPEDRKCHYVFGDWVSVDRWDRTERKQNQIGSPARVLSIVEETHCESGFMVLIKGTSGRTLRLDSNWIAPYHHQDLFEI